jgi:excinuclease ABC subunit A
VVGGRCDECQGNGQNRVEMIFLADLMVQCEVCGGSRFKKEVLEIEYKGKSINQVLRMSIKEALTFFDDCPAITKRLAILDDVGLGYLRLGQPAPTLSGGEAQRIKLAGHMINKPGKSILYLFDEPTTGLHFDDISKLLSCFDRLIERGHSVLVIEHNLDVIKCADWIIDLGPEGGNDGGFIVVQGSPEEIAQCNHSYTGHFLKPLLFG